MSEPRELLAEIAMFPVGMGESLSVDVAKVVRVIAASGLSYSFTAMGTIVEGTYDEVSAVIKDALTALSEDSNRVYATIKFDYRKGRANAIEEKVHSVTSLLD